MKELPAPSFYEWLILFKDVDRPVGDLAQDALQDPDFPKHGSFEEIFDHLQSRRASRDALETFRGAYTYYKLDVRP